jgi:hypothetical protein
MLRCIDVHVGPISHWWLGVQGEQLAQRHHRSSTHPASSIKIVGHEILKENMLSISAKAALTDAENARAAELARDRFPAVMTESGNLNAYECLRSHAHDLSASRSSCVPIYNVV